MMVLQREWGVEDNNFKFIIFRIIIAEQKNCNILCLVATLNLKLLPII